MRLELPLNQANQILTACDELLSQSGFIGGEQGTVLWRGIRSEPSTESSLLVDLALKLDGASQRLDIHATRLCHRTALLGCDVHCEERIAADLRALFETA